MRLLQPGSRPMLRRRCAKCHEPFEKMYKQSYCDPCKNKKQQQRQRAIRIEAYKRYGPGCKCCGEVRLEFLTIDHIGGGGGDHRRKTKKVLGYTRSGWMLCDLSKNPAF